MNINPCTFYQPQTHSELHRKITVISLAIDLTLILLMRLLTLFFTNGHKQRVDDILRNKVIPKDVIQVENIINTDLSEQTGMHLSDQSNQKLQSQKS